MSMVRYRILGRCWL